MATRSRAGFSALRATSTLVAFGLAFAASVLVPGCGGGSATTVAGSGEVFVQSAGEIFLEPAGAAGPESFAGDALLVDHAVPSPTSIPTITPPSTLPGMPVQIASYSGGTPGLYGGSRSKLIADKDAQLKFLQANLGKAAAFVAALNADPTLRWSGGTQVSVEQLAAYFAELTPVLLTRDIRVTNHGYRDGKPTPRQSVLQAGQYVLVDIFGVPRARCECGNPLIPPRAVATKPKYTGTPWPTFDPSTVIVIQQTTIVIETFVLIDMETGQTFERPIGSSGAKDAERTTTTTMPPTIATTAGATTSTVAETTTTAPELTHGPLSGTATGWYGEGNIFGTGGNDGREVGSVTYPEGVIGQAFGFDGSSYVEAPDVADPAPGSSDFTIALWVYFDVVGERDPFISHDEAGGQTNKWIFWYDSQGHDQLQGQGALRFHVNIPGQTTTDVIAAPWEPQPGTWYHVAVTRAQGAFRLYIDGELAATQASDIVIPDPSAPVEIGRAESFYHVGRLDEVQMWSRALGDADIRATYGWALPDR